MEDLILPTVCILLGFMTGLAVGLAFSISMYLNLRKRYVLFDYE